MKTIQMLAVLPFLLWEKNLFCKIFVSFATANMLQPFAIFFEAYIFNDWDFARIVVIGLSLDIFFGGIRHMKARTFDFYTGMQKFTVKVASIIGFMIIMHGLLWILKADRGESYTYDYLQLLKRLMVYSAIMWSILANIHFISDGAFPPVRWMKRFKEFRETADTKELEKE